MIQNVTVLGAGIMGNGIAQVSALAGYKVILRDIEEAYLDGAYETIKKSLSRMVASKKISEKDLETALDNIQLKTDLAESVREADLVIEAIPEVLSLKQEIFEQLDYLCPSETILATNTSQLSVTLIGAKVKRKQKVIGAHFFNPVAVMRLVEIVRGLETSDETIQSVIDFCGSIGKETVVCKKDTKGFITTRLLLAQRAEAFRIYNEGIASIEDIDKAMKLAFRHPLGPFELADLAGLDTGLKAIKSLEESYGDRFKAPQYLEQMVELGHYGRKNGKGFYHYNNETIQSLSK